MRCIWCSNPEGMDRSFGKDYSLKEIVDECISCKPMFFKGGGVTFTGGEATVQFEELKEVLAILKQNGIHTCIETNATHKKLCELSEFIDYLIMDYKHFDGDKLTECTGCGTIQIEENFKMLCSMRRQLHVRIPLINGINTDSPEGFTAFFKSYATDGVTFEFLPYHEYGKEKWKQPYTVTNGFINDEILRQFTEEFEKCGLNVINT